MHKITNLVFDGGGVKSFAYVGAVKELVNTGTVKEEEIQRVSGTSAGSIIAMLLALGYTVADMPALIQELDCKQFIDSWFSNVTSAIYYTCYTGIFGISKGKYPLQKFKELIKHKTGNEDLTFRELHALRASDLKKHGKSQFKDLYVTGYCLNDQQSVVISHEHNFPDLPIATAIRLSISLPILFIPVTIDGKHYMDGGINLKHSYKIHLFDNIKYKEPEDIISDNDQISKNWLNPHSLGFRLNYSKPISAKIKGLMDFIKGLLSVFTDNEHCFNLSLKHEARTIYCDPCGVKTDEFDISVERKDMLFNSGAIGVKEYLAKTIAKHSDVADIFDSNAMVLNDGNICDRAVSPITPTFIQFKHQQGEEKFVNNMEQVEEELIENEVSDQEPLLR